MSEGFVLVHMHIEHVHIEHEHVLSPSQTGSRTNPGCSLTH